MQNASLSLLWLILYWIAAKSPQTLNQDQNPLFWGAPRGRGVTHARSQLVSRGDKLSWWETNSVARYGKASSVSATGTDGLPEGSYCRATGCKLRRSDLLSSCIASFRAFSAISLNHMLAPNGVLVLWWDAERRNFLYVCSEICRNDYIVG